MCGGKRLNRTTEARRAELSDVAQAEKGERPRHRRPWRSRRWTAPARRPPSYCQPTTLLSSSTTPGTQETRHAATQDDDGDPEPESRMATKLMLPVETIDESTAGRVLRRRISSARSLVLRHRCIGTQTTASWTQTHSE